VDSAHKPCSPKQASQSAFSPVSRKRLASQAILSPYFKEQRDKSGSETLGKPRIEISSPTPTPTSSTDSSVPPNTQFHVVLPLVHSPVPHMTQIIQPLPLHSDTHSSTLSSSLTTPLYDMSSSPPMVGLSPNSAPASYPTLLPSITGSSPIIEVPSRSVYYYPSFESHIARGSEGKTDPASCQPPLSSVEANQIRIETEAKILKEYKTLMELRAQEMVFRDIQQQLEASLTRMSGNDPSYLAQVQQLQFSPDHLTLYPISA